MQVRFEIARFWIDILLNVSFIALYFRLSSDLKLHWNTMTNAKCSSLEQEVTSWLDLKSIALIFNIYQILYQFFDLCFWSAVTLYKQSMHRMLHSDLGMKSQNILSFPQ